MVFSTLPRGQHLAARLLLGSYLLLSLADAGVVLPGEMWEAALPPQCSPKPRIPVGLPPPAETDNFLAAIASDGTVQFECVAGRWVEQTDGSRLPLYNYGEVLSRGKREAVKRPGPLSASEFWVLPRGNLGPQIGHEVWGTPQEPTPPPTSGSPSKPPVILEHTFYIQPKGGLWESAGRTMRNIAGKGDRPESRNWPTLWEGRERYVEMANGPPPGGVLDSPAYIATPNSKMKAYRIFHRYAKKLAGTRCQPSARGQATINVPYRALWLFYGPGQHITASDGSTKLMTTCMAQHVPPKKSNVNGAPTKGKGSGAPTKGKGSGAPTKGKGSVAPKKNNNGKGSW